MSMQEEMKDVIGNCGHSDRLDGLCKRCKMYLCSKCQVASHFDHIEEIQGLDSLLTEAIAQYAQLSGALEKDLVASKSSVKDGAIDEALLEVEKRIADEYDKLAKDIQDLEEEQIAALRSNPFLSKVQHDKEALEGDSLRQLTAFDQKLGSTISLLLSALTEEKYEGVLGLLNEKTKEEYLKEAGEFDSYYERQRKFKKDVDTLRSVKPKLAYSTKTIEELVQIRGAHEEVTKLILFDGKTNAVYVHVPKTKRVIRCDIKQSNVTHKAAQARLEDHTLLLCGGKKKPKTYFATTWLFDIVEKKSRDGAPMHEERAYHGITSRQDLEVFVAGGECSRGLMSSAEKYDVKADRWDLLPSLTEAKRNLTLCLCGDKYLYAIGGAAIQELTTIEVFNTADTKGWEAKQLKGVPEIQKAGAVQVADGQIFVFGGKAWGKSLRQTYLYDLTNSIVIPKAPLLSEAAFNKSDNRKVEGLVYATGNTKAQTNIYDLKADQWTTINSRQYLLSYSWD